MDLPVTITKPDADVVFYTMSYKKRLIYWYLTLTAQVGVTLFLLPVLFRDFSSLPFFLLWICIGSYNVTYFYRLYRVTRLVLSNWGIRYYGLRFQMDTSWEDLGLARNRTILSLFTPVRLTSKMPLIKRFLLFDWDLDTLWGKARYFIPLSSWHWDRYAELVELINQHRPDLGL